MSKPSVGGMLGLSIILSLAVALVVLLPTDTRAELIGCRSSADPAQITGVGNWAAGGFEICWNASFGGGIWTYQYTITESVGTPGSLSHIIFELTPSITVDVTGPGEPVHGTFGPDPGNPGIPGSMYGVKIDNVVGEDSFTFTLTTPEAPVWGDFYAKDGDPAPFAFNTGFTDPDFDPVSDATIAIELDHIVRPDGIPVRVSEPGSLLLGGIGLLSVGGFRRRRFLVSQD